MRTLVRPTKLMLQSRAAKAGGRDFRAPLQLAAQDRRVTSPDTGSLSGHLRRHLRGTTRIALALIATLTVLSAPMLAVVHGLSHQREAAHDRAFGAVLNESRSDAATATCTGAIHADVPPAEAGVLDDDLHPHPLIQAPYSSRQTHDVLSVSAGVTSRDLLVGGVRDARQSMTRLSERWPPPPPSRHSQPRAPPLG